MRGLRSTIALFVILIGLGAYIYFVTSKAPDSSAPAAKERVFAALPADKIDEIKVKSESGDITTVKKNNGAWQVTSPLTVKADETEVNAITSSLGSLEVTRVVDENPGDLKEYGLDAPRVEIDFKASGDKDYGNNRRLVIGAKSPTGGDLFARRDADKRVILIAGSLDPIFNRSTLGLRDKSLLTFERDKVDRIELSADGKTLELARDGNDWKVTKPIAALADNIAVDGLLGQLQSATLKSIPAEQPTPADLKKYGFDKPQATATLKMGTAQASLVIGGAVDATDVYARDLSRPFVATSDNLLLKELRKGADEYRRKEIFAFRGYSTDRLEFTRDGQTVVFEKVKGQGGQSPDKWRRVSPNAGEPDAAKMETLLSKLESLRAATFLDSTANTGLDTPALTVYAKFEDGKKEERVSFAKAGTPKVGTIVYAANGQPGAVTIATTDFDDAVKALDDVAK